MKSHQEKTFTEKDLKDKCFFHAAIMAASDPKLKLIKGKPITERKGETAHFWIEDQHGEIIDPTISYWKKIYKKKILPYWKIREVDVKKNLDYVIDDPLFKKLPNKTQKKIKSMYKTAMNKFQLKDLWPPMNWIPNLNISYLPGQESYYTPQGDQIFKSTKLKPQTEIKPEPVSMPENTIFEERHQETVKTSAEKKYYIDDSKIHGKGVFASKEIKCKEPVGKTNFREMYLTGKDVRTDLCKFLNHSEDGNVFHMPDGLLYANKDIRPGEEITSNYYVSEALHGMPVDKSFMEKEAGREAWMGIFFDPKTTAELDEWVRYNIPKGSRPAHKKHVTVKYGVREKDPMALIEAIGRYPKKNIKLKLGRIGIFRERDHDVVKIDVKSPDAKNIKEIIETSIKTKRDQHDEYRPHITLAYLPVGQGSRYVGSNQFENRELKVKDITYIGKDLKKFTINIPLAKKKTLQKQAFENGFFEKMADIPILTEMWNRLSDINKQKMMGLLALSGAGATAGALLGKDPLKASAYGALQGLAIPIGIDVGVGSAVGLRHLLDPRQELELPGVKVPKDYLYYPRTVVKSMQPELLGAVGGGLGAKKIVDWLWGEEVPAWWSKHVPFGGKK